MVIKDERDCESRTLSFFVALEIPRETSKCNKMFWECVKNVKKRRDLSNFCLLLCGMILIQRVGDVCSGTSTDGQHICLAEADVKKYSYVSIGLYKLLGAGNNLTFTIKVFCKIVVQIRHVLLK